jgi:hypothetical protein
MSEPPSRGIDCGAAAGAAAGFEIAAKIAQIFLLGDFAIIVGDL